MSFGAPGGTRGANIVFDANTGRAKSEITELGRVYQRTTGQMSTDALRLAAAQEKLNRTIERSGPESTAAKTATVAYRREVEAVAAAANRETAALDRHNRELSQATRGAIAGSGAFRGLGRSIAFASGGFLGTAGLVYAIRQASAAGSNLVEQTNKVDVVFGRSAGTIKAWSETTASAIGLASDEALAAAGTFGNLFNTVSLAPAKNAELSRSLVNLAADLASFNNANPAEVLDALRSGLIGEAEPLRRYGVLLSEARVQQEALRATGKENAKELTNQDKLLARVALIYRDTSKAQGDFARTSGSLANQQRILHANIRDLEGAIGLALNPAILDVTESLNDYLGEAANQERIQRAVNEIVRVGGQVAHGLAEGIELVHDVAAPLVGVLGGVEHAVELLVIAMAVGKVRAFAGALGLIGPAATKAAAVSTATTAITAAGDASVVAAGRVSALRGALLRLGALGVITLGIDLILNRDKVDEAVTGFLRDHGLGALTGGRVDVSEFASLPEWARRQIAPQLPGSTAAADQIEAIRGTPDAAVGRAGLTAPSTAGARGAATAGRFTLTPGELRDLAVQRARTDSERLAAARAVVAADRPRIAFLEARLRAGRGNKQKQIDLLRQLYAEEQSAQATIDSIEAAAASRREAAAADRARKLKMPRYSGTFTVPLFEQETKAAERLRGLFEKPAGFRRPTLGQIAGAARSALAARLGEIPIELQLAEANAKTEEARENILRRELKALERQYQIAQRNHLATKSLLEIARQRNAVRSQLDQIDKTRAQGSVYTLAQLQQEALADLRTYGSTIGPAALSGQQGRAGLDALILQELRRANRHHEQTAAATRSLSRGRPSGITNARALAGALQ